MTDDHKAWAESAHAKMGTVKDEVADAVQKVVAGHDDIFVTVILAMNEDHLVASTIHSEVADSNLWRLLLENAAKVAEDCGVDIQVAGLLQTEPRGPVN
jgi:hypothetical protein